MQSKVIFDFNKEADIRDWKVTDDVVMGGVSSGTFNLSPDGYGLFEGTISLDNSGGFSSARYRFPKISVVDFSRILVKVKGDGKRYQLRVKDNSENHYAYIAYFETIGEWQEIEIPLKEMYPTFRGRKLDFPNFSKTHIEELAFLIANKKAETFRLLIDQIRLEL